VDPVESGISTPSLNHWLPLLLFDCKRIFPLGQIEKFELLLLIVGRESKLAVHSEGVVNEFETQTGPQFAF
jgi:hypothetical protein